MATEVLKIDASSASAEPYERAAEVLRGGGLVAFPTETVYGVGVRADDPEAVARLRAVKQREAGKPFTVHIGPPADVHRFVPRVSAFARRFLRKAWPGPVTLVFPVDDPLAAPVIRESGADRAPLIYHEGTVGVRCPDDPVARRFLIAARAPVVAASANRADHPPPRSAVGVLDELDGRIDLVLDGGAARYAKPSTVVKLDGTGYRVLRLGVIDERMLERFGSWRILFVCSGNTCRSPMAAALCARMLAERAGCSVEQLGDQGVYIESAGAACFGGSPGSSGAKAAMAARGLVLDEHASQPLTVELIHRADRIYGMTRAHVEAVRGLVPAAADKTSLLVDGEDVDDPVSGSDEVYAACAQVIEAALEAKRSEMDPWEIDV